MKKDLLPTPGDLFLYPNLGRKSLLTGNLYKYKYFILPDFTKIKQRSKLYLQLCIM